MKLVLGKDAGDSRLSFRRRQVLSMAQIDVPRVALEVGAFDNPTVRSHDGFIVRYADYFSADELRAMHAENPRRDMSRIVDVDYVIKGPRLSPFIGETVDLLIANHVIEHLCDPIGWLCDIEEFCSPDAVVFLAVPDKRYTFDYLKQPSDITGIVKAHEEAKVMPDAYDVARMRYLHTRVDAMALWKGGEPPKLPQTPAMSYRDVLDRSREEVQRGSYVDVHCTFFTAESFLHIFRELNRSQYIAWQVELLHEVDPGGNEFYVLLRRGAGA